MKQLLLPLASLRLTLAGMLLLAFGAALSYNNPATTSVRVLVVPMALLAINLLAAIITNQRINRRGGLLTFHLALLGVVILAAIGRLTHLEAHIELLQDTAFSSKDIFDDSRGPLHRGKLDEISFVQGPYTVDYAAGMLRGLTHSQVRLPDGQGGWEPRVIASIPRSTTASPPSSPGYRIRASRRPARCTCPHIHCSSSSRTTPGRRPAAPRSNSGCASTPAWTRRLLGCSTAPRPPACWW